MGLLRSSLNNNKLVLHPADVAFAVRGERLETLLGSCVAVILTTRGRDAAAMCHFMYSTFPPPLRRKDTAYASVALPFILGLMQRYRQSGQALQAFVYGGAHMFPDHPRALNVGQHNLDCTWDYLAQHDIGVVRHATAGACYRKVVWTVGDAVPELSEGHDAARMSGTPAH
jgi:chemotaxis protein CheD